MDLFLIAASPSHPILFSHFLNPIQLRKPNPIKPLSLTSRTHHYRLSGSSRCFAEDSSSKVGNDDSSVVFKGKKELKGIQLLADSLSPTVRLASSVVIVASAIAAGYGLGVRFGGSRNAGVGGAVAVGAAGSAAVYTLNSCVSEVAAVNLHNFVAGFDDPKGLRKEDIEGIASRYGVSKQDEAFNAELCDLYSSFILSVLPPGSEPLKGNEVEAIIKFKDALGLDDPDAASVHIEIGRRMYRERLETGDREAGMEQRRAFQKLIYVSTLVFGEASTFLLPWKRLFMVTDAQVDVAIRDSAQRLYASMLKSIGRDVDEKQLIGLREAQLLYRLSDELAADMFREHTRKLAEEKISAALAMLKSRTRSRFTKRHNGYSEFSLCKAKNMGIVGRLSALAVKVNPILDSWIQAKLDNIKLKIIPSAPELLKFRGAAQVIEELDKVLAFNNQLMTLSNHYESSRFALGVGPISLLGGEYDGDRKMDDLKLLYKTYVTESYSSGRVEEDKLVSLNHLKNVFGLGKREAEGITLEVTSKVYRSKLVRAVSSGELEAADSKASYLQNLCEELYFDPQKASEIHEEIYRQKLQQSVTTGELSEKDVSSLLRLRVLLCIPQKTVEASHADICGSLFEKAVKDAIAAGVDGYDADAKASVRKAAKGLRLTREAAMDIASKAVRKMFVNYVKLSRSADSRTASAKELKKMIAFNTLVVTELVCDIKGESNEATPQVPVEVVKEESEEEEDWESIQTLRKTRPDKELGAKAGQTEITLKDDLPLRDRTDLYKTYLLYCITGEVTKVPFGAQINTKKDDSEYLLLNQLGGILGLTGKEMIEVHRGLAEQAFRQQAEVILADGQLTKARVDQLSEVQKKVGLPAEYAQKVIKSITTSKIGAAIETAVSQGRLSIKQIRELKEANMDLDTLISKSLRENLYKKTVDDIFSSGTGEFNEEEVYEKIPLDLSINAEKSKQVVHELAKTRLSNSLVQAVSLLRQKNKAGVVSSLNDLLACDKAVPAEKLPWEVQEELVDLFSIYLKSNQAEEKISRLQSLLGIADSTAAALNEMGDVLAHETEEEFVF
ncbi:hypothetical protein GIB67_008070 [Kingdonia uniflora]|uniref:Chloroplast inner envelope protein n=1 Tax=Kingdonia uniflora TaxID=39325 RepID=A0A7J7MCK0_9MAGN|nr:hypothetical protein GIB67_008070 [Kingdonia uniflora]